MFFNVSTRLKISWCFDLCLPGSREFVPCGSVLSGDLWLCNLVIG